MSKKKLEFARTGKQGAEILQKAELKELTDGANTPTMNHVMATMTGSTLEKLKQDPEKLEQARAIFDEATRIGFNSSVFQVTYKMKPDKLELANELLMETQVLRDSGEMLGPNRLSWRPGRSSMIGRITPPRKSRCSTRPQPKCAPTAATPCWPGWM